MGTAEGGSCLVITTLASGLLFYLGMRKQRLAAVVERTPTTSAAQPVAGGRIEVTGTVVAGEKTFETLVPGRRAVWCHLSIEEVDDSGHDETRRTVFDDLRTAEFIVDDRSGRTARVVPPQARSSLVTSDSAKAGTREQVLARLKKIGVTGFNPKKLAWKEKALYVGDTVYVLGRGEVVAGPPEADGYRTMSATEQLVMRGTPEAPLVLAAMTEARYLQHLKGKAASYFIWGLVIAAAGALVSVLASLASG